MIFSKGGAMMTTRWGSMPAKGLATLAAMLLCGAGAPHAGGGNGFGPQRVIDGNADGAADVAAADLDGDGDLDALSDSNNDDLVSWYENVDGGGRFGPRRVIATLNTPRSVFPADVDGDGDVDVFALSGQDDLLLWYENMDGSGSFGPQRVIANLDLPTSLFPSDFDGDGDLDLCAAQFVTGDNGSVVWYENTDGQGQFGPARIIVAGFPAFGAGRVFAADIDGDSDQDVLVRSL